MPKFLSITFNWLKKQYSLLLLLTLFTYTLFFQIKSLKDPLFAYQYDEISTCVVLGLYFLLTLYGIVAACWHLNSPHSWRNTAKIWMQCTLAGTVISFIDLYYIVTLWARMNEFLSVEIINAVIPTIASIRGLYKISTGSTFTPRQAVLYTLALTLGGSTGTLGLYLWFFLFRF